MEDSLLFERIAQNKGMAKEEVVRELNNREAYLKEIVRSGVRDQREVTFKILSYYIDRREEKNEHSREPRKKYRKKRASKTETDAPLIQEEAQLPEIAVREVEPKA